MQFAILACSSAKGLGVEARLSDAAATLLQGLIRTRRKPVRLPRDYR
jgi:hypothetical protein